MTEQTGVVPDVVAKARSVHGWPSKARPLPHRHHFTVEVIHGEGTYSSSVLEEPGVHSQGDTEDEAINNALHALVEWREADEFKSALEWTLAEHDETLRRLGE
jgi:predicted RNase H-like HicB family nuclease